MANGQDYGRLIRMLLGQGGPNPYMGLDIGNQLQNRWDRFAQQYLPQAPGMQKELFQQPLAGDDEQVRYNLMRMHYGI